MKLPVMSVRNYSMFVRGLATELERPPHGVFANIAVEPDPKSQFKVMFEVIGAVPDALMPIIMRRHSLVEAEIGFPYTPPQSRDEPTTVSAKLKRGRQR
jgi:hypothetical protein